MTNYPNNDTSSNPRTQMHQSRSFVTVSPYELLSRYRSSLMGFAALWIFNFHTHSSLLSNTSPFSLYLNFPYRIGFCGVDVFILLSGIGCVHSLRKYSVHKFYMHRAQRILPPYLIISGFYCYLRNWSISQYFLNFFGINFYRKSIFSFLWFIPAIAQIYLLFPPYFLLVRKASAPSNVLLITYICWFGASVYWRSGRKDLFCFTNRIPILLVGIYIAVYSDHFQQRMTKMRNSCSIWVAGRLSIIFNLLSTNVLHCSTFNDIFTMFLNGN